MIDRIARDQLSGAIRRLVAGRISNHEYEASLAGAVHRTQDVGVQAIRVGAWLLYSDIYEHRLKGRHAVTRTGRRAIARWIVFLESDLEYEWYQLPRWRRFLLLLPDLLTFGAVGRFVLRRHDQAGEEEAWPFYRWADCEAAALEWPRSFPALRRDQLGPYRSPGRSGR